MQFMKRTMISGLLLAATVVAVMAQSGTRSPYSQYGMGVLSDQSQGFGRGMNGVGLALRMGNQVNTLNPASYSCVDSLTMLFDMGISGQMTNFKEGATRVNARTANFDYVVGSFRLLPNVGVGFGILPLTNVNYEYESKTDLGASGSVTHTYTGTGGLHQFFVGAGWRVAKPLSLGFNAAYVWGGYERGFVSSASTYIKSLVRDYEVSVGSYKLDFGLQYIHQLKNGDEVTLGATVGVGHSLGARPECCNINVADADTTMFYADGELSLPMTYGLGLAWTHNKRLTVGADFTMQQWGSLDFPTMNNDESRYVMKSGLLKDCYKVNVGADWIPDATSRNLLKRVHYRGGAGFATSYYKVNGTDGPNEFSVSAGFGIPLQNSWNNRSVLNISAQWAHASAKNLIVENTFRINIGLTFNERWFMKWKVD